MPIPIFLVVCSCTYIIPVVVGLARFRKLTFPMKILGVLTIFALTEIAISVYVARMNIRNYFVTNYTEAAEVSLILAVYYASAVSRKQKLILVLLGISFFVVWLGYMALYYDPNEFGGAMPITDRLFMILGSIVAMQSLVTDSTARLFEQSLFWMIFAVILDAPGSLIGIGLFDRMLKDNYWLMYVVYHINWSLDIATNLLYSKALLCKF